MYLITIDGNIGVGKSTILRELQEKYSYPINLEPVDEWQPFLTDIYENDSGYFEFQVQVYLDRAFIQSRYDHTKVMFMERSPKFTKETFVEVLRKNNKLNQHQFQTIQELYNHTDKKYNKTTTQPSVYIYIRLDPEKCLERISKRSRDSENMITLEYLKELHDKHEECYNQAKIQGYPIHVINGDNTVSNIVDEIRSYINVTSTGGNIENSQEYVSTV